MKKSKREKCQICGKDHSSNEPLARWCDPRCIYNAKLICGTKNLCGKCPEPKIRVIRFDRRRINHVRD